jgi:putative membrane protein
MTGLLLAWIGNSLAILFVDWLFDGVRVSSTQDAFIAGAVLGIVNSVVRPILVILTLPVTILTLGLFYFVVSGFCLWLTSSLLSGFEVNGVLTHILAAIVISLVSTAIASALKGATKDERRRSR